MKALIAVFLIILISCAGNEETNNNFLDPAIPLLMKGNYVGDCYKITKDHTGQIGGFSIEFDTIFNSELSIVDVVPVTYLYHKVTAIGDCLPMNEFMADNDDFNLDTVLISDRDNHDYLELKWIQSEKVLLLFYQDREDIGVGYIDYLGTYRLK